MPPGTGLIKCSRFTEEQIIKILYEQEAGLRVPDPCRKHGVSDATFYKWKTCYGGFEVSEAMLVNICHVKAGIMVVRYVQKLFPFLSLEDKKGIIIRLGYAPLRKTNHDLR